MERGPAEHGWADQRWTLARIATLIARLFHLRYTLRGTAYLLHRMGWCTGWAGPGRCRGTARPSAKRPKRQKKLPVNNKTSLKSWMKYCLG